MNLVKDRGEIAELGQIHCGKTVSAALPFLGKRNDHGDGLIAPPDDDALLAMQAVLEFSI